MSKERVRGEVESEIMERFRSMYNYHGAISEHIRKTFHEAVENEAEALQRKLEREREARNEKREERRELDAEIATHDDKIAELEKKLQNTTTQDAKADARIEDMAEAVAKGSRIPTDFHRTYQKVRSSMGLTDNELKSLIRNRVKEDGSIETMDVPDAAFRGAKGAEDANWRKELDSADERWLP